MLFWLFNVVLVLLLAQNHITSIFHCVPINCLTNIQMFQIPCSFCNTIYTFWPHSEKSSKTLKQLTANTWDLSLSQTRHQYSHHYPTGQAPFPAFRISNNSFVNFVMDAKDFTHELRGNQMTTCVRIFLCA